ncbi:teichoic acid D-Ala incorporation-associated protein DltX [Gottfriedia acidiceleris]|uniref:teichoic acid D-Ala incorporation-associated protein DltX n=1 Tax=Gottfriedia acidiceleris TaxID=371036 RepID=UPI003AF9A9CB
MKEKKTKIVFKNAMIFQWFLKTSYYLMIIILLIYFYICNSSGSSTFIYNEF